MLETYLLLNTLTLLYKSIITCLSNLKNKLYIKESFLYLI